VVDMARRKRLSRMSLDVKYHRITERVGMRGKRHIDAGERFIDKTNKRLNRW